MAQRTPPGRSRPRPAPASSRTRTTEGRGPPSRPASGAGPRLITHPYNRGKGAALKTGIRAARGDTVVVVDADGQHDPEDIPRLLAHRPMYDMVMGDRGQGGGASPLWRTPGKAIL